MPPNGERDEDRQEHKQRSGRAVMLWIHGGALVSGESDDFDASRLVELGGVIVVTVNYRLGALGFLAHPALSADRASGNYGIMDQQAAVRWVRRNIGAFGGDPGNVTIFGQSPGGLSVLANIGSPGAAGLFHRRSCRAELMSWCCRRWRTARRRVPPSPTEPDVRTRRPTASDR
jgi:para-nitrobenzyl esterase